MRKFLLPLLFLLLFIVESLFVEYLPEKVFGFERIFVPHFLFIAILFLTIFVGRKHGIIYAAIFGLLFDVVYVEIIGIYFFLFPFISYLIYKLLQVLQSNIITAFLAAVLGVSLLEIGVYEMNYLIHVTDLDFIGYMNLRFYPSLILNAGVTLIVAYPLKWLFEKHSEAIRAE
ncbi:rod shape-determining protein MreD [Neobacillus sp. SuZ13]|uniref:rod shape-determining protein MreD n=1 Tax=Neobacillus sp. SuZ13 TaxID=3047875 RepID=UPI0024C0BD35|nr:rod shape-determining protein MreD [Neobacillus sp. SuZ13]WHY65866.1 rod shape-determining protein MreD [Neobacillus sp. SuZ13]